MTPLIQFAMKSMIDSQRLGELLYTSYCITFCCACHNMRGSMGECAPIRPNCITPFYHMMPRLGVK